MANGPSMRAVKDSLATPRGEVDRIKQADWWSPVRAVGDLLARPVYSTRT